MNHHPFIASVTNKVLCAKCDKTYIMHTKSATCESCSNVGNVEPFGELKGQRTLYLCSTCTNKEIEAARSQTVVRAQGYDEVKTLAQIHQVDQSIRFNGDFYNSKIASIEEMRVIINNDESIKAEDKHITFQKALMERFVHLRDHIFELDEEKFKDVTEQLAIRKTLNELGNELRKEIREKIAEADRSYIPQPIKKPVIKAVVKEKSPEDRVIEALALARGISKDEARKLLATVK